MNERLDLRSLFKMNQRRLMGVAITPEILLQSLLTTGPRQYRIVGAPEGAKMIRCGYDREKDLIYAILEHESFEVVSEGNIVPMLQVMVTTE